MFKLLNFLGTVFTFLLLGFIFFALYKGVKYLGDNATQTEEAGISGNDDGETHKGLLGNAMDKAAEIGGTAKDKIVDAGSTLKDKSKATYESVSQKVNEATEKLDESVSNLRSKDEGGDGYSEVDDLAYSEAAKREAELKKAKADELTAKGSGSKSLTATKSSRKTTTGKTTLNAPPKGEKKTSSSKGLVATNTQKKDVPKSYDKAPSTYHYVIVGSFKDRKNALAEVQKFKKKGYPKADVVKFKNSSNYNVAAQKNTTMERARRAAKRLEDAGIPAYVRTKK